MLPPPPSPNHHTQNNMQDYMEKKDFVQKCVKIKMIRGKGQRTYECSQKEYLESKI